MSYEYASTPKDCVRFLRDYAHEGFPRRIDGSFPTDVLTALRVIMEVSSEDMGTRDFERAISAGQEFDSRLPRHAQWTYKDTEYWKERLS